MSGGSRWLADDHAVTQILSPGAKPRDVIDAIAHGLSLGDFEGVRLAVEWLAMAEHLGVAPHPGAVANKPNSHATARQVAEALARFRKYTLAVRR